MRLLQRGQDAAAIRVRGSDPGSQRAGLRMLDVVKDVIENFLMQRGFLVRTARRRVSTRTTYAHFRLAAPTVERDLNLPPFRGGA
jgi:hypothetical protein